MSRNVCKVEAVTGVVANGTDESNTRGIFLHLTADEHTWKQVLVANNGTCKP